MDNDSIAAPEQALAEASRLRSEFMAEASAALARSLDYNETLRQIAALAVPRIADWSVVSVLQPDGALRRVSVVHRDPARAPLVDLYLRSFPPNGHPREGAMAAVRQGRSVLFPEVGPEQLATMVQSPEHLATLLGLGIVSFMIVPLRSSRQLLGALSFVLSEGPRRYGRDDLILAEDLAGRAAAAVENALLYREAQEARARLEEAVRVREDFISVASHELRTPLAALQLTIQGALRAHGRSEGAVDWAQEKEILCRADAQVKRLGRLIDNLLDLSRVISGGLPLDLTAEPVDLAEVVAAVTRRHEEEARGAGCALTLQADGPCAGSWDRLRLEQLIGNLISNAIKYGREAPVEVSLTCTPDEAVLRVRDRGIGIAPTDQARIFQRFERAASSRHYGGLGLGLWIAAQIAEAMGGRIEVQSELAQGATFTVTLPRRPPRPGGPG